MSAVRGGHLLDRWRQWLARRSQHRLLPRRLRTRLALTYALLIIVLMAILGGYLVVAARHLYVDRLSGQLANQARLVGDAVAPELAQHGGIPAIDPLVKEFGRQIGTRVTVIAPDGTVLGDSENNPVEMANHNTRPEVIAARKHGVGESQRHSATEDRDFLYVAVPIAGSNGAVARVALELSTVDGAIHRVQRDLIVATVAATLLAAAVAAFVARRITAPLEDLHRQVQAVAAGDLEATVVPAGTLEIGQLGRAFNSMTERLRESFTETDQARLRLSATLENLTDGVVITDEHGEVVRLNDAAARQLQVDAAHAVGRPFVVVCRDHELAAMLRQALTTASPQTGTVEYRQGQLVLEATASVARGEHGEALGLVVLHDVTELRRLEGVRREFVANVSHELRTPLASIKAVVETLEAGAIDDPEVAGDFLTRINGEVDRLAMLVDELLDLARLEAGRVNLRLEDVALSDLVRTGGERLRHQIERAQLTLDFDLPSDLPGVRVDRARIEQVLINLVHNAIKFTPPGGSIRIEAALAAGVPTITVRDTGVGIAPEELPRLFERFYKTDRARSSEGTGLGLAIAKHIVQAHGGTIWVESTPGAGAIFSFTVPLAPREHKAANKNTEVSPTPNPVILS